MSKGSALGKSLHAKQFIMLYKKHYTKRNKAVHNAFFYNVIYTALFIMHFILLFKLFFILHFILLIRTLLFFWTCHRYFGLLIEMLEKTLEMLGKTLIMLWKH